MRDHELPPIESPNGKLELVQVVGVTADEVAAAQRWDLVELVDLIRRADPWLRMDLARRSVLASPELAEEIARRTEREGSSCGVVFAKRLGWTTRHGGLRVRIDRSTVPSFLAILRGRLPFGRELTVCSPGPGAVTFLPGEAAQLELDGEQARLTLNTDWVDALVEELGTEPGLYELPGIVFEVVPEVLPAFRPTAPRTCAG